MSSALEEQLLYYGGGGEHLFFGGDGAEPTSPEERIKSLLGEDRGLMRRRIVRRPMGGASSSQLLSFTDREGDGLSPSMGGGGDPLSDLLSHLAASRKAAGEPPSLLRASCDGHEPASTAGASPLSALALLLAGLPNEPPAHQPGAPTAAEREQRSAFVQQLMLGSLSYPLHSPSPVAAGVAAPPADGATSDRWRLDAPAREASNVFAAWLKRVCGVGDLYATSMTAEGLDSIQAICAAEDDSDWPREVKRGHRRLIRTEAAAALQLDPGLSVGGFPSLGGDS
jgi:hypothetical protein